MLRNHLFLSLAEAGHSMNVQGKGQAKYGFNYVHPILSDNNVWLLGIYSDGKDNSQISES